MHKKIGLWIFGFVFLFLMMSPQAWAYKVGDKGKAPWGGKMYNAEITKINGDQCFLHWLGEDGRYDEWKACADFVPGATDAAATTSTLSFKEGDPVSVEWKGSWWPAHVLKAKPGSWLIHYDGYDNSWDEWVGPSRIKKK